MDSRIILTQADFSANNIGRYVEMLDLTKKVLAKQTQYDIDSSEAIALNAFLANLVNDGFIGGSNPLLTFLAIPALASGHDELFYDIAFTDSNGYPTQSMAQDELSTAEANRYINADINNDKIVGAISSYNTNTGGSRLITMNASPYEGTTFPSMSMVCYRRTNTTNPSTGYYISTQNDAANNKPSSFGFNKNYACLGSGNPGAQSGGRYQVTINDFTSGFIGISYDSVNNNITGLADNATFGETTTIGTPSLLVSDNSRKLTFAATAYSASQNAQASFLAFGKFIDSTNMAKLKNYVDTLMVALHVKSNS